MDYKTKWIIQSNLMPRGDVNRIENALIDTHISYELVEVQPDLFAIESKVIELEKRLKRLK